MPARVPQKFTNVIVQPRNKLQTDAVVDTNSIFLSCASDEDLARNAIHQDQAIVLTPQDFPPDIGMQVGGGRNTLKLEGRLRVKIWNRYWGDEAGRDDAWLTDPVLGIGPLVDSVTNSLEQHDPVDGSGNYYYTQPLRLLAPGWSFPPKRVGDWGVIESFWSLHFWMLLT